MRNHDKPEISQNFNEKAAKDSPEKKDPSPKQPSTKYELENLEAQRQEPKPSLNLTPSGGLSSPIQQNKSSKAREERIHLIKERLANSQEKLRSDWNNARD